MAMVFDNPVQYNVPVFESGFSDGDIDDLLRLFQEENQTTSNSASYEMNRTEFRTDERKLKRKISNRESAQRSRKRKKQQLEDLTLEANQLKMENQKLVNRLLCVRRDCGLVQAENQRVHSEQLALKQRLSGLYQTLATMQFLQ